MCDMSIGRAYLFAGGRAICCRAGRGPRPIGGLGCIQAAFWGVRAYLHGWRVDELIICQHRVARAGKRHVICSCKKVMFCHVLHGMYWSVFWRTYLPRQVVNASDFSWLRFDELLSQPQARTVIPVIPGRCGRCITHRPQILISRTSFVDASSEVQRKSVDFMVHPKMKREV